jgi:hypothetical protein
MLIDELRALASGPDHKGCVVGQWVFAQDSDLQEVFTELRKKATLNLKNAYLLITSHTDVPFKMTAFRAHMRGVCACPKA